MTETAEADRFAWGHTTGWTPPVTQAMWGRVDFEVSHDPYFLVGIYSPKCLEGEYSEVHMQKRA
jgi:hypothetical protein